MPRPRVYKAQAIVLRQRKLGEADKIVTLYTAYGGKVDAVAKGVRRTKSRLGGHLEPLTHGSYLLAEGRDLDIVTQAETIDAYPALRADLDRVSRGLYCAELVDRLTPERSEGNPIYRLLEQTLGLLSSSSNYELAVRRFELRLLGELGYRPALIDCAVCDRRLEPQANYWSVSAGGAVCPSCADDSLRLTPLSLNGLKMLRLLQRGTFEEASRIRLSGELAFELEQCLTDYVRYILEREVRSARFVETLRTMPAIREK
ncbi:MAG TPA: DNA repair protein RecO [Dehalococcoidia bacterium]|jgi:DNA repair protein RecO (recombination protein O)|nr:DNA repair protein RecO [Dehalococcoidia bacterium]